MTETNIPDDVLCDLHEVGVGQHGVDVVLQWQHAGQQCIGLAFATLKVVDTPQDHG